VLAPIGVGGIWLFWFSRRVSAFVATPAPKTSGAPAREA